MEHKPEKRINVSRPKDKTLEAYKTWIMEMAKLLTMEKNEIQWTEEEWIANWKKFWKEKSGG
jgi:hypothetical protein